MHDDVSDDRAERLEPGSITDGAMYLPPDVFTRSFFRSVILHPTALVDLTDVTGENHPSASRTAAVWSGIPW